MNRDKKQLTGVRELVIPYSSLLIVIFSLLKLWQGFFPGVGFASRCSSKCFRELHEKA